MSLIRLEKISKAFAGVPVLEEIDFRVEAGEKIGLIGRNGSGKSTLFRLVTGELPPDGGVIERMKKARVASLAQLPRVDDAATIFDIVLHSFASLLDMERELGELEDAMAGGDQGVLDAYSELQERFTLLGGYDFRVRIKQVLTGLGFHPDEFSLPFHALSGGQRTRLMLSLVLLQEADLLLLDEPENHLDLEAREWLEDYLKNVAAAVVIVSHDRRMLHAIPTRIVEVERNGLTSYSGNYAYYDKQKTLAREQQQAAYERQQEFIRKEQAWIDRFRYKATKAKQVQSRIKRLEKMEVAAPPPPEASAAVFRLGEEVVRSSQVMLEARDLSMGYDKLTLYEDVSFTVNRGERVGIIGPNGAGKTTLLRQLAGMHPGLGGKVTLGNKVRMAMYDQHHEGLNPASDVLAEVHAARPQWTPEQIRTYLGRFLFRGEDVFKPVEKLSGGELSRVAMARLILGDANLVLLDEPTNHLDIASREALEQALEQYPGAIVMISHDRALIDRLVNKLIIIENGKAEIFLGNYSAYRWKTQQEAALPEPAREAPGGDALAIRHGKDQRENKKARDRQARKQQRKLEKLEADIAAMEAIVSDFEAAFAAQDPSDYARLQELKTEYDGLKADLQALYAEWENLAEDASV